MGVLDSPEDVGVGATLGEAEGPVDRTGFFPNVSAGYKAAQAGPGSTRSRQNAAEARYYDQIIKALTAEGEMGEDFITVRPGGIGYRGPKDIPVNRYGIGKVPVKRPFRNPSTGAASTSQGDNPLVRMYLGGDQAERQAIWDAVQKVRARKPDFLKDMADEAMLSLRATKDRERRLAEAQRVTARAGTPGKVGAFIGGLAGSLSAGDPENVIGGGAGAAGKTVGRTIIKRALQEGAVNAAAGTIALPGISQDTERLGGELTAEQAVRSVVEQAVLGAGIGTAIAGAPPLARKVGRGAAKVGERVVDVIAETDVGRDALVAASLRAGTVKDRALLREYRRLHSPYSVGETATPDEKAAIHVIEREIEVREASPFSPEQDGAHESRLDAVAESLGVALTPRLPSPAPEQRATVSDRSDAPEGPRRAADYTEAVHRAEGTGKNPDSSAVGHFQFIDSTWLEYAPRVTDTKGMSAKQILALRSDRGIAGKAERAFRGDNARYLRERGLEDTPGNLSLAHFLGRTDAAKVLKADPSAPVSGLVDPDSLRANRSVLAGKSAAEVIAWAHKRIGAAVDGPVARADAVPAFDPLDDIDYAEVRPYGIELLRPDEVETDAGVMQYKSGGDEAGVTGALEGAGPWNPILSQQILVLERLDGRRTVVDGHQRTAKAKREFADDPSIRLPAVIIREVDGITVQHARVLGALRNITNGTGTLLDNARVLRDAPNGARMLPPNVAHARESAGLSRLSYEAFGAVTNEIIDPRIAAQIGLGAPDTPDSHMALVDLLKNTTNPREAANIVRQASADGYGTVNEVQLGMFGDAPTQSLYVPIARIMDAAAKRLRDEKRTFKVLSDKAAKIEGAGNVLDRSANQEKVISSDEALAILNATAHRSGPVRDALIAAARAELSGARRGDAVGQFLDDLAGIDLRAAARGVGRDDGPGGASERDGREVDAAPEDGDLSGSDGPSLFDDAVAVRAQAEVFSDPVGAGAKRQTELLEHDLRPDPNIAARQSQETALKAEAPLRSVEDQEGTMGLALFDTADQPTFRLDEEGDARPLSDILKETEADEIAAQAARDCL